MQTIWSSVFRRTPSIPTRHQRFELADGDFIDLEWLLCDDVPTESPVLLLLHGLEGSIDSTYIQGLLQVSQIKKWNTVVMHFRGCGKEPNRLPRSYHSGETDDLQQVLKQLKSQHPQSIIMTAGFSLGGNVLLKYLGESNSNSMIDYAAAISVPFVLSSASLRLDKGFSRLYRNRLLKELKQKTRQKINDHSTAIKLSLSQLEKLKTFFDFDDQVTAPLHGFKSAKDYYQQCSSRQFLSSINTPTLIVHAVDDPFMTSEVIPDEQELSDFVTLELSDEGGHVGFVSGRMPWNINYYIDQRICQWFQEQISSDE